MYSTWRTRPGAIEDQQLPDECRWSFAVFVAHDAEDHDRERRHEACDTITESAALRKDLMQSDRLVRVGRLRPGELPLPLDPQLLLLEPEGLT